MKIRPRYLLMSATLAGAMLALNAPAGLELLTSRRVSHETGRHRPQPGSHAVYGHATAPGQADRTIEIGPGRRLVNVSSGETVLFRVSGKSFAWRFTRIPPPDCFALRDIAPADVPVPQVTICEVPDLYERARPGARTPSFLRAAESPHAET